MPTCDVRFATRGDLPAARELLTAQLVEHHLLADASGVDHALDLLFEESTPGWLLLAFERGVAVGACLANRLVSVEKGGLALWIEELYVVPASRRRGIATALLSFLSAEARKIGGVSLDLEVVRTQAAAFALYAKQGFKPVDRDRLTLNLEGLTVRAAHAPDEPSFG